MTPMSDLRCKGVRVVAIEGVALIWKNHPGSLEG